MVELAHGIAVDCNLVVGKHLLEARALDLRKIFGDEWQEFGGSLYGEVLL